MAGALAGARKKAAAEGRTLVWVDQSGCSLLPLAVRTWAPCGRTPVLTAPLTHDHLSAIGGITSEGRLFMQTQARASHSEDVVGFLRVLLRKIRGKLLVIWDGAPIHRGQPIKDFLRSGCAWRHAPCEYGPWPTVYWYFRQWRLDGTWKPIYTRLRELARLHAGRDPTPSAAIIDSQSIKTHAGGMRGFDGAKKVAGRKRHILVDTEGHLLVAVVHAANLHDRDGGRRVLEAIGTAFPRLQRIWADQGYTGSITRWAADRYGLTLDVVYPFWRQLQRYTPAVLAELGYAPGFHVLPRSWVVEQTFSWIGRHRWMSEDYERLTSTAEALIYLVGIRLLLARLTRA